MTKTNGRQHQAACVAPKATPMEQALKDAAWLKENLPKISADGLIRDVSFFEAELICEEYHLAVSDTERISYESDGDDMGVAFQ